ncbi:hypothetical protein LSTR_LSTR003051 [Laodelphax striatellus]|uniref:Uncharacterized protein n=1 Tax=Laodelphax striatellus TaxID=195883 RepID=A0A482XS85_LAOST|nr:hypothetical protein LSTR_LSTR003051 [Laodelphax striatellus]
MDKRITVKGQKKLIISAKRKKRRLPPEVNANRRRRIEEQTLPPEVPSSSQADIGSSDTTVSSQNFQPSVTSTPYTKESKKKSQKRSVPAHLMKWRLHQKERCKP